MKAYLSICIPSYNRYNELERLLESIDSTKYADEIEIVIREDMAPNRKNVRQKVDSFKKSSIYSINYIENETNYGYDKNIRNVAKSATGTWVMFMGDDDVFIKGSLDRFIEYLHENDTLGYVLRRYRALYASGEEEEYRYYTKNMIFEPGENTIVNLFRRSVFISGFTFKRSMFSDYDCDDYDGTLLFQLYILAVICLNNKAGYCDIPISESIEGGIPYFGSSEAERNIYSSGSITFDNSINFLKQVRKLTESFDLKYNTNITSGVLKSYSKYSYGYLHEHRNDGVKVFRKYAKEIKRIGLGDSFYFYIYYYLLLLLGRNNCRRLIMFIKKIIGHTPRL